MREITAADIALVWATHPLVNNIQADAAGRGGAARGTDATALRNEPSWTP